MSAASLPLEGQTGIVTGSARGLGRAIARRLAQAGMRTVLADMNREGVEQAVAELADEGLATEAVAMDATSPEQVRVAFDDVAARHGQLHVLVNNAGIYPYIPFDQLDLDGWRKVIGTNTESAFLCSRAAYDAMRAHGYGRIVTVASATFFNGEAGTAYVASKAALIGFTRALAYEIGPHGITVNAVTPGLIDTEGMRAMGERADDLFAATVPGQCVKRPGAPEDIAEAIAYIASPAASFLTGQVVNVDGGARFN